VLAALAAALFAAPVAGIPVVPQRIVAVGDLHGDWDAWIAIARAAGLVDASNRWAGGRTIFVQLGDITDRGPHSRKIIRHLRALQREARRSGGKVVVLVGNHEAMNVIGDLRYVHPGEYAAFADRKSEQRRDSFFKLNRERIESHYRAKTPELTAEQIREKFIAATPLGMIEHQQAWSPTGELGRWTISNPAVAKIGDILFVHGGLSAEHAALPLEEINRRVAAALTKREQALDSIISDPLGPLWYRGNVDRDPAPGTAENGQEILSGEAPAPAAARVSIDEELDLVLNSYGARHLVVGHTPNLPGIAVDRGGRLVRIDTGISRHYGGQLSFLEIIGGKLVPHSLDRPATEASQ
ncbi:MAG TPA: metallophosphoesterase, partial [Sphingomicrobium sp.]|nr:metallophosphoesterase [Sphingomicrobium sp.]